MGRKKRESAKSVNRRWMWVLVAAVAVSVVGGYQWYWLPKQLRQEARTALAQGDRLRGQNRGAEAAQLYRRAVELDSTLASAWNALAVLEVSAQRLEAALPLFDRALALDPRFFEAQVGRAIAHEGLGRFLAAEADYKAALALRPRFGGVH